MSEQRNEAMVDRYAQMYELHDIRRLKALERGDSSSARLEHKATLRISREAFIAGFAIEELWAALERRDAI